MPRGRKPIPIAQRFWTKVDKRGPDDCWLWTGSEHGKGYGGFSYKGRSVPAQRISWLLEHGDEPPPHLFVCHKCDVPKCVNPAHLFLGTHDDNMKDMAQKNLARSNAIWASIARGTCNPWRPHVDSTGKESRHLLVRAGYAYDIDTKKDEELPQVENFSLPQKIY